MHIANLKEEGASIKFAVQKLILFLLCVQFVTITRVLKIVSIPSLYTVYYLTYVPYTRYGIVLQSHIRTHVGHRDGGLPSPL
jgi:hypothetical protein